MDKNENVAYEFIRMGRFLKVSAIDMTTGKEVSIVGDPAASEDEMKRIALAKLLKSK